MSVKPESYSFPAPVLRSEAKMFQHYIPVPHDIVAVLEATGSKRVIATICDVTVRRAILGRRDGERFIVVSRDLLRQFKCEAGDILHVNLRSDPDPNKIDLGEEFETVLEQDPEAAERFFGMTTGKQRSLAHYTTSAKRVETRIKRALELAYKLRTFTLHGDNRD